MINSFLLDSVQQINIKKETFFVGMSLWMVFYND